MGLRARLALIVTVAVGLSLVATLAISVRYEVRDQLRNGAERAGALLQTMSVPIALFLTQGRVADLDNLMAELAAREEGLDLDELLLVDHEGRVLADTDALRYGKRMSETDPFIQRAIATKRPLIERINGSPSRISVPVQTGIRWATLIGSLDEDALEAKVYNRIRRLVLSAIVAAAAGILGLLLFLSIFVVNPIVELGRAAERFAEGDLTARTPVRGKDEISTLARALNAAGERLQNYTADLAAEVAVRTKDLAAANDKLTKANRRLETLAITDGLTGLFNHRHFRELLRKEIRRQERGRRPFSILMLDVDHFKNYNDTHGHPAGDEVLKGLARILTDNTRKSDVVARYGGEEFILMLTETAPPAAEQIAEKLRSLIAEHAFAHAPEQPMGCVSVSMGLATWPDDALRQEDLIEIADQALYIAKRRGRNQVCTSKDVALEPARESSRGEPRVAPQPISRALPVSSPTPSGDEDSE